MTAETENVAGSSKPLTVDVVDDLLFLGPAFTVAQEELRMALPIRRVEASWIRYIECFDEAAGVVIIRAELQDHVPTVLKVRALAAIGAVPVVVAEQPSAQHVWRLYEAGAGAVLTGSDSFESLLGVLLKSEFERQPANTSGPSATRLSDRELQVACLYTGPTAPSARVIGELLRVPHASVRSHLQRAREALREVADTSNREGLKYALQFDGWVCGDAP